MMEGIILIVTSILFFALTLYRFDLAILCLIFALPFYEMRFSVGPIPSTLLEVMLLTVSTVWIYTKTRDRGWSVYWKECWSTKSQRVFLGAIGFFVFTSIGAVLVSPVTRAALGVWRAYFIEPILFFFILQDVLKKREQLQQVLFASIASGFSIACGAIIQRVTGWGIPLEWARELRVTSIYPYPNAVGLYLAPITAFVMGMFTYTQTALLSRSKKIIYLSLYGLVFVCIMSGVVFAQTEAALAAIGVSMVLFGILWGRDARRLASSALVLFALALFLSAPLAHFFEEKVFLKDWSGRVRKGIWKETASMLHDRWFVGAGLAGYKEVFPTYHTRKHIEVFLYPHSFVLNFWTETGVMGLVGMLALIGFFFFFVLKSLWRCRLLPRSDDVLFYRSFNLALLACMTTILIHGLVDVPYFKNDLAVFFWMLLALALISERQTKKV